MPPAPDALEKRPPTRGLTTRERIILLEGSKLNGYVFLPLQSPPGPSDFESNHFDDDVNLSLSDVQLAVFDGWRRAFHFAGIHHAPSMGSDEATDLVQDVTTDCSVIASLCAASARLALGRIDVITCNIFPQEGNPPQPTISPCGRYIVRLYFNGCPRKVSIDDRLPTSRTSRSLHVVDRKNPSLLWPALVEKAYLKVRGGYDFPGSNSGTDLWVLTGWIPEQLFIQSDDIVRSALWRRLHNAFNYGDVLVTMGTGRLTTREEEGMGLAGEHDYAVIDIKERRGQQLFLMKNPWSEGTIWKGHVSEKCMLTDLSKGIDELSVDESRTSSQLAEEPLRPGTFWMGLSDVFQSFESIYLNWNPKLFSTREDVHFTWDLCTCSGPGGSLVSKPQYAVCSSTGGTVWLLLSRHFTSKQDATDQGESVPLMANHEPGFISLYAFHSDGKRVLQNNGAIGRSPYVDSPNSLLKVEVPANAALTIAVSEQGLPRLKNNFTLTSFSFDPCTLITAPERYSYKNVQNGEWTALTAGGNAGSLLYHKNPQFKVCLAERSDLSLLLETLEEDFLVHIKLVWAKGQQIHTLSSQDIVGDSGEYRKGFAVADLFDVDAGVYTLVCSTFEQGQLGNFTLHVLSDSACEIKNVATETAGRYINETKSAMFLPGTTHLIAPLLCRRLNRVNIHVHSTGIGSRLDILSFSPVRLLLEHGKGQYKTVLGSSGDKKYQDGRIGARILGLDIHPDLCVHGGIWVIIERLAVPDVHKVERMNIEIVSDEPVELGDWDVGERLSTTYAD